MKKLLVIMAFVLSAFILFGIAVYAENPSEWARGEVQSGIDAGFVPEHLQIGYTDSITRAEFAELAVRFSAYRLGYTVDELAKIAEEKAEEHITFSDADSEYVSIASMMEIIKGMGDGTFKPDDAITREQAAVMLLRTYANYAGTYSIGYSMNFEDKDIISGWAFTEIQFCMANKVMWGVSETRFDPKGSYTREQAIATFIRLANVEEWKSHNASARYRRKMTREEAVEEYINQPMVKLIERFDTPYGTALYCVMGGMMHAPGYFIHFFDNDANGYDLTMEVPRESFYAKPALEKLTLSDDKSKLTFEVTFNSRAAYQADGEVVLHEKGTYYFEADLKTAKVETYYEPNPIDAGIEKYLSDPSVQLIERIDTEGYGSLIYVKSVMTTEDRYLLVLIGNDGNSHLLAPGEPVLNKMGKTPPITNIKLHEYSSVVSFERRYDEEQISQSPDLSSPGTYYARINLITLETETSFIKDNQ